MKTLPLVLLLVLIAACKASRAGDLDGETVRFERQVAFRWESGPANTSISIKNEGPDVVSLRYDIPGFQSEPFELFIGENRYIALENTTGALVVHGEDGPASLTWETTREAYPLIQFEVD